MSNLNPIAVSSTPPILLLLVCLGWDAQYPDGNEREIYEERGMASTAGIGGSIVDVPGEARA